MNLILAFSEQVKSFKAIEAMIGPCLHKAINAIDVTMSVNQVLLGHLHVLWKCLKDPDLVFSLLYLSHHTSSSFETTCDQQYRFDFANVDTLRDKQYQKQVP